MTQRIDVAAAWKRHWDDRAECGVCGKVALLKAYYDRRCYYSGKACSDKCAEQLPGQGASADYEPDHREDDDD